MNQLILELDDALLAKARKRAAERNVTVAGFITQLLRRELQRDDEYEANHRAWSARAPFALRGPTRPYPRRAQLYERTLLRRR